MILVPWLACAPEPDPAPPPPGRAVPTLDEAAWLAELRARRPELLREGNGSVRDPGWLALTLRPEYRQALLDHVYEDPAALIDAEYADDQRAADEAWASTLREAHRAFVPTGA